MCKSIFEGKFCVRSKFSCVLSSHDECGRVPGQFVADNSWQNIILGSNFKESTISISETFFSSIPLPLQQHYFITPASISAIGYTGKNKIALGEICGQQRSVHCQG